MVTCPVNRYSYAMSAMNSCGSSGALPPKSETARIRTLFRWGRDPAEVPVRLSSFIPAGKGMASSTADISAVCQAAAWPAVMCWPPVKSRRRRFPLSSDATFSGAFGGI